MVKIATIILAAGESRRMGEPKALVRYHEGSFLETIVTTYRDAGIENVVVVLGHHSARILEKVQHLTAQFVINQNYAAGQLSSFQVGVANLASEVDGVFLAPVDQPQIGVRTVSTIREKFLVEDKRIIIPTYNGKKGHPPIFPKTLFKEIVSAPLTENAAAIFHRHPELVRTIEVDDESILWNINTKKELAAVRQRLNP